MGIDVHCMGIEFLWPLDNMVDSIICILVVVVVVIAEWNPVSFPVSVTVGGSVAAVVVLTNIWSCAQGHRWSSCAWNRVASMVSLLTVVAHGSI